MSRKNQSRVKNNKNKTRKQHWKAFDECISPTSADLFMQQSLQTYQNKMDD